MLNYLQMLYGIICTCLKTIVLSGAFFHARAAEQRSTQCYGGELALHSYGTEPDSWHSEDDL